ncbi:MAG: Zn-dependent exopeptidase M28 [Anaerolineaceae bacterium]|nr:Zn-dependent exopeptidase M28 [Anaerolineaceae bacterium]
MTVRRKILFIIAGLALLALILVLVLSQTDLLSSLLGRAETETAQDEPSGTVLIEPTDLPVTVNSPTTEPTADGASADYVCAFDPLVETLQSEFDPDSWLNWIELLSGAKPVEINGETYTIKTRYVESLFNGDPDARAFEFVHDQLTLWGYEDQVTLFTEEYMPVDYETETPWQNLVAVIPGTDPELAGQEILLTAHLDSITVSAPEGTAPGADDNATGVATLLEAARIFRDQPFRRTIKIVFFSGEERGLHGSLAYTAMHADEMDNIVGVVNLDMFGYDADNDRCFELHVGSLPESNLLGTCLTDVIDAYELNLSYDYLTLNAVSASDHSPFWSADVGAVLVLENFITQDEHLGCGEIDRNPNYHTSGDLVSEINVDTAFDIAQAALLTVATIAEPVK